MSWPTLMGGGGKEGMLKGMLQGKLINFGYLLGSTLSVVCPIVVTITGHAN